MAGPDARTLHSEPPRMAGSTAVAAFRSLAHAPEARSGRMSRIAILYPGELGAPLGRAVVEAGGVAITCLFGRSEATRGRTTAAQFSVVPSLEEVARQSDLVISLVPPTSAVEIACSFAASVDSARCRGGPPA